MNNRWQAVKMAESLEKKLNKKYHDLPKYNKEFDSYLSDSVIREVSGKELEEWT